MKGEFLMIINPTKKSISLFTNMKEVADKEDSIAFSQANPLFSWHAHYFNVKHKKILLLINDLTCTPIVLADINAKNRQYLPEYIEEGIRFIFAYSDISEDQINRYLALAGSIEINSAHNRSRISIMNQFIGYYNHHFYPDFSTILQKESMVFLADDIISALKEYTSVSALQSAFTQSLKVNEPSEKERTAKRELKKIEKNWMDLNKWASLQIEDISLEETDKLFNEIEENNQLVLNAFQLYLKENLRLSDKIIKRHVGHMKFYLNEFLMYRLESPLSDLSNAMDFIDGFYADKVPDASATQIKQVGAAMKKFYQFLAKAGDTSAQELSKVTEFIEIGVESGQDMLDFY
jgi:hypothetical protein